MRLYLSSFRNGDHPEALLEVLGEGRKTGVIFNAADVKNPEDRDVSLAEEFDSLKSIGLEPEEVDLRAYFSDNSGLKAKLQSYDLLWVRGGNVFVLRRAFRQSGADEIVAELLAHDEVVYGGYSAGIDILTPNLHGLELCDDPNDVQPGYDLEIIWDCLGILPYHVAPHYKSDHPESAAIDNSIAYYIDHHMPFIALRDGEAIVIDGDEQRIVGVA